MKKRTGLLCGVLGVILLTGCSLIARRGVAQCTADLSTLPRIDPNEPNSVISIETVETGKGRKPTVVVRDGEFGLDMGESPCRVKYHDPCSPLWGVVVEGQLADESRRYPIRIDTGSFYGILVTDVHLLEHKLPIYGEPGEREGVCYFPDLRVSNLTLRHIVANYSLQHWELYFLGLSIKKYTDILVGVPLLRKFKYVAFDGVKKELEFSNVQSFRPQDQSAWSRYPFLTLPIPKGEDRICVGIPVAGESMTACFDTGYTGALITPEPVWQRIQGKLSGASEQGGKSIFAPFFGGGVPARHAVVKQLKLGDRVIGNAAIVIAPADPSSSGVRNVQAILGMQCFAGTTVVLDFEQKAMWVKNSTEPLER